MGAWSYEILENDTALDLMSVLTEQKNIEEKLRTMLDLNRNWIDIHELALAIAIVDVSLNGIDEDILGCLYEYRRWFEKMEENPINSLKADALAAIRYLISYEADKGGWVQDVVEERHQLLVKIKNRLEQ